MKGIHELQEVGYPDASHKMSITAIVCKQNLDELPKLWRWCRENRFSPDFERVTYLGRARDHWHELRISPREFHTLARTLLEIDQTEFGLTWEVQPPHIGYYCTRHYYGCLLDAQGFVQPCSGLNIHLGNIRHQRLKTILENSPIVRALRFIDKNIKGACKECPLRKKTGCYGCRAQAYHITGDFLAADPECWRNPEAIQDQSKVASERKG
jgi:MoaA/NifB/PqqE/SkfB family radical SAM enzyme